MAVCLYCHGRKKKLAEERQTRQTVHNVEADNNNNNDDVTSITTEDNLCYREVSFTHTDAPDGNDDGVVKEDLVEDAWHQSELRDKDEEKLYESVKLPTQQYSLDVSMTYY